MYEFLYKNNDPNSDVKYVIDESKFGTSKLSTTKSGAKQMSEEWLFGDGENTKSSRIYKALIDGEMSEEQRNGFID